MAKAAGIQMMPSRILEEQGRAHFMTQRFDLDALFEKHTDRQYTRSLLFSTMVDLMGVVVSKSQPSIHAAFQEVKDTLPVSLTAVYDKLNGLELAVTSAMVRHSADKLAPVIVAMRGQLPPQLPGYRARIIDGNHFAATERRLKVLKRSEAGPLASGSVGKTKILRDVGR